MGRGERGLLILEYRDDMQSFARRSQMIFVERYRKRHPVRFWAKLAFSFRKPAIETILFGTTAGVVSAIVTNLYK